MLRYIANMIYRDIFFHDISRYITWYNQIYWYIAIYLQNIVGFPNTFCKIFTFFHDFFTKIERLESLEALEKNSDDFGKNIFML